MRFPLQFLAASGFRGVDLASDKSVVLTPTPTHSHTHTHTHPLPDPGYFSKSPDHTLDFFCICTNCFCSCCVAFNLGFDFPRGLGGGWELLSTLTSYCLDRKMVLEPTQYLTSLYQRKSYLLINVRHQTVYHHLFPLCSDNQLTSRLKIE